MAAGEIVSAEVPLLAQLHWKSTSFLRDELEPWSLRMGLTIYELLGTSIYLTWEVIFQHVLGQRLTR